MNHPMILLVSFFGNDPDSWVFYFERKEFGVTAKLRPSHEVFQKCMVSYLCMYLSLAIKLY